MVNQTHRIGIVLQARVGSTRLPGKVLMSMAGKPMLQWILERLRVCNKANVLILATTALPQDDAVANLGRAAGIPVFRGSDSDVLDRYYQCALLHKLTDIVRATGDNPFVDAGECDRLLDFYLEKGLDYATSKEGDYPVGVGLEVFSFSALEESWQEGHAPNHREHVDEYILENPTKFRQARLLAHELMRAPDVSLTVDTAEQFNMADRIYREWFSTHSDGHVPVAVAITIARRLEANTRGETR